MANRIRFFSEIFAADLQPALWKTAEFFEATYPSAMVSVVGRGESLIDGARCVWEYPISRPAYGSEWAAWACQLAVYFAASSGDRITNRFTDHAVEPVWRSHLVAP